MQNKQTISLQNKISNSVKLSEFFAECAKEYEISTDIYNDLRLVIEETFVNIASYAFAQEDSHTVTVEAKRTPDEISITFTDDGIAFNPLTDPTGFKDTDDHCEGGMGIRIITSLTDYQEYNRIGKTNVFTVTKYYTKPDNTLK